MFKKIIFPLLIVCGIAIANIGPLPGGSSGGGGAAIWGDITGTLANQTDLSTALDAKVNDTGNETVAGTKTFSSAPICSAATASRLAVFGASKDLTSSGLAWDTNNNVTFPVTADGTTNSIFLGTVRLSTHDGQTGRLKISLPSGGRFYVTDGANDYILGTPARTNFFGDSGQTDYIALVTPTSGEKTIATDTSLNVTTNYDGTPVIATSWSTAGLVTIGANGGTQIHRINGSTVAAGSSTATLTNSPVAGDPAVYLKININGTAYLIPGWTAP